jgi:hypothetical protein
LRPGEIDNTVKYYNKEKDPWIHPCVYVEEFFDGLAYAEVNAKLEYLEGIEDHCNE